MKQYKKIIAIAALISAALSFTACDLFGSSSSSSTAAIVDKTPKGSVSYETSNLGISASSSDIDSKLTDNTYYVLHNGKYYPIYSNHTSYEFDDNDATEITSPSPYRQRFYTIENEINIPTLFPGDQLIFYSTSKLTDVIYWERFYDDGTTFGIFDLKETEGGRYYINFEDEDQTPVFAESELYEFIGLGVNSLLIDKVGGIQVTKNMVENRIIKGATKGQTYDMEVYTGTIYKHYNAVANFHAFHSYELFSSTNYTTLQKNVFEIEIPSYFTDGYYDIDGKGLFRLCKNASYSDETDFNQQLLYPQLDAMINTGEEDELGSPIMVTYSADEVYSIGDYYEYLELPNHEELKTSRYSENEAINHFKTNISGTVGFVDPNEEYISDEPEVEIQKMKVAKQIKYDLWFPQGKDCQIIIPTEESVGEAYIEFSNGSKNKLTYNKLDKQYETSFSAQGIRGTIVIGGLTKGYEIKLKNIEIYNNQDGLNGKSINEEESEVSSETEE